MYCSISEAIAYRGDVIGCTVKFGDEQDADGKFQIVFTLNGKPITQEMIVTEHSPVYSSSMKLYPYICMGYTGMTVLAKVSINPDKKHLLRTGVKRKIIIASLYVNSATPLEDSEILLCKFTALKNGR